MSAPSSSSTAATRSASEMVALREARQATMSKAGVDRRLIGLVVHGIGEQAIGATLKSITGEFLTLARTIDPTAGIAVTPLDEGDPHEIKLWFKATDQRDDKPYVYEVRFIEVWWAKAFEAPGVGEFVWGLFQIVGGQIARIWKKKARFFSDAEWKGLALWQRLLVELLVVPLGVLALLSLIVGRVVQLVVPKDKLPPAVTGVQRLLVNAATRHLGDVWAYMREPWEGSRIRVRFEERFRTLIELMDKADPDNPEAKVESVFVIAHSLGSAVAYEALSGRRMTALLGEKFGGEGKPEMHLITAGSALNWAWDIAPEPERFRFHRQLHPNVNWLNLWSGPDPVARGRLDGPDIKPGEQDVDRGRETVADADVMVVNQNDIFSDHVAYWSNAEEVIAPILDRVTRGALTEKLTLRKNARRVRVEVLATLKLFAYVSVPLMFVLALALGWGAWAIKIPPNDFYGLDLRPDWLEKSFVTAVTASLAIAMAAAVIYSSIVKWVWDYFDRRAKYKPGP